ncbi:MAG: CotH kinase family protein [Lachnospiraceae bacterium]|nr:CotH kinase family protein [Lachnospiraceae bacterium]
MKNIVEKINSKKLNGAFICLFLFIFAGIIVIKNSIQADSIESKIEDNKLIISTAKELCDFSDSVNDGVNYQGIRVILDNDIDLGEVGFYFQPIGIYDSGNYFFGIFDGQGHTIRNFIIDCKEGNANNGLFGVLGGTVCNLSLDNGIITGNESGAICATSYGDESAIYNCVVNNVVLNAYGNDGMCGEFDGRRENVIFDNQYVNMDDWGMLEEKLYDLNNRLMKLSEVAFNTPMNHWEIVNDRLVLSTEADSTVDFDLYLSEKKLNDSIKSFYSYSEGVYYIVLPYENKGDVGYIEASDAYGNTQKYNLNLEDKEMTEINVDFYGKECQIKIMNMENTPSIFISTGVKYSEDILIRNKDNELEGTIQVFDEDGIENYNNGLEAISGRGYHSWQFARKKGYGFKLLKKGNLLGLGNVENYVLLPGHRDESILSYVMTMEMDKMLDWPYAPDYRLVNYYLDGEYQGLYILCEKIEIGKNRVNIKERVDETGSYLYEMRQDCYEGKEVFAVDSGNTYLLRGPKFPRNNEKEYSIALWNEVESGIFSNDGISNSGKHYTEYIDLPTWARLFTIIELNAEFSIHGSLYFYKESDAVGDRKIHALQPWDVEHSYILDENINDSLFRVAYPNENRGLLRMLAEKQEMKDAERKCWEEEVRPVIIELLSDSGNGKSFLWNTVDKYKFASKANEIKWGEEHNFSDKAASIEQWLNKRIQVLDRDEFY